MRSSGVFPLQTKWHRICQECSSNQFARWWMHSRAVGRILNHRSPKISWTPTTMSSTPNLFVKNLKQLLHRIRVLPWCMMTSLLWIWFHIYTTIPSQDTPCSMPKTLTQRRQVLPHPEFIPIRIICCCEGYSTPKPWYSSWGDQWCNQKKSNTK